MTLFCRARARTAPRTGLADNGRRGPSPRPTVRSRRGASLVSTVAALGLTVVCLTLVVHAAVQGERFATSQAHRAEAFAACQGQMETLRAGGYSSLPALGMHAFHVTSTFAAQGEIVVAAGPVADSRTITVRVSWPLAEGDPAGRVELSTVMAAKGLKP